MSLVFYYLVMVALLTFITAWSFKKGGHSTTVGELLVFVFVSALPVAGLIFALCVLTTNVLLRGDVKTFFGKVIVEGDA